MALQAFLPLDEHKQVVLEYWLLNHRNESDPPPLSVLPDGSVELICNYGDPYQVRVGEKNFWVKKGMYIRGVTLSPIRISLGRNISIWGARLNPVWLRPFCQLDMAESFEKLVYLGDIPEVLSDFPRNPETLKHTFSTLFNGWGNEVDPKVLIAVGIIDELHGTLSIQELAESCALSISSLERKFQEEIGVPPKVYSQLIRFKYISRSIASEADMDQMDVISKFDLTDHSHLNKLVKSFSNETPGKLKSKISRFFTKMYLSN